MLWNNKWSLTKIIYTAKECIQIKNYLRPKENRLNTIRIRIVIIIIQHMQRNQLNFSFVIKKRKFKKIVSK